ncbi:MAG: polysaccharide biosynthesis tyrosine autokinase [Actinomycetota bacterium]|nr:polysaccharide biosynthesis tyrosine autokinase [Actinomycetota bacterium]
MLESDEAAPRPELRRYLATLRRRKLLIALTVLVTAGAAVGLSLLQDKAYQGEALVLLQPRGNQSVFEPDAGVRLDPALAVETEIVVLKSPPVQAEVERRLGRRVNRPSASRVGDTLVIKVTAQDREPRGAAEVATAYADAFIELRRRERVNALLSVGEEIETKIAEVQRELEAVEAELADSRSGTPARTTLENRRAALVDQEARFRERLDQLEVDTSVSAGVAELVSRADVPSSPVRPKPIRNGVLGGVVGLLLGVALASLFEAVDESIKTREEVLAAGGLPVLGTIPSFDPKAIAEEGSPAGEAFRSLRTSVQLLGVQRPLKVIQFSSPGGGEGKTTVVANLAVVLVAVGLRVLVVDLDLRRRHLHEIFDVPNDVGFTSLFLGEADVASVLRPVPAHDGLVCLPAGPLAPNPSELLASRKTAEILFDLQNRFDVVVIDCAPVLPVTDAILVAPAAEATVLVVRSGQTTRRQLRAAIDQLRQVDAPLKGAVLNDAASEYAYGYAYGEIDGGRVADRGPSVNGHRRRKRREPADKR